MPVFTIDPKKCNRCGICVAVCPGRLIAQPTKKDFPSPVFEADEFCIDCGHCEASCPHDALTLTSMALDDCPVIGQDRLPDAQSVRLLLKGRRSIRAYKKKTVPQRVIQDLIDTARFAPTGSNKQEVCWTVISRPEDVHHLAGLVADFIKQMLPLAADEAVAKRFRRIVGAWDRGVDRIMRNAPHLILASSPPEMSFPEADCATALGYLELYAFALGLGTCWAGYFTAAANAHPPIIEFLALPAGHQCHGAVMLGYPKFGYRRIPKRKDASIDWR